jgi:putative spermidine/putrescine transport system permease protein
MRRSNALFIAALPALVVFIAFWLLPVSRLILVGASGKEGVAAYFAVLTNEVYRTSLVNTVLLSAAASIVSVAVAAIVGVYLQRREFMAKRVVVSLITFPLAFPGVVIGFLVILLAGRQGLIGQVSEALGAGRIVFAYSLSGLFLGYLYFSIPRCVLTLMAAAEKLDPALEEAARSLGAGPIAVVRDVIVPRLMPALIASGAICFATSMGAFGTAFTLASKINVLPITIYSEFTNYANFAAAASLSLVLGVLTWAILMAARSLAGQGAAAA